MPRITPPPLSERSSRFGALRGSRVTLHSTPFFPFVMKVRHPALKLALDVLDGGASGLPPVDLLTSSQSPSIAWRSGCRFGAGANANESAATVATSVERLIR